MTMQDNVLPLEPTAARSGALVTRPERCIGAILVEEGKLSHSQVDRILDAQGSSGQRFGEIAVRMGFLTEEQVRFALAKQFDFPHLAPASEGPSRELVAAFAPFHPRF